MQSRTTLPGLLFLLLLGTPAHPWEHPSKDGLKLLATPQDPLVVSLNALLWPTVANQEAILQPGGRLSYAEKDTILSLSDGDLSNSIVAALLTLHRTELGKTKLIRTDWPGTEPGTFPEGIDSLDVNNEDPLPFEENQFDAVVMRNGICECVDRGKSKNTCGGIRIDPKGHGFTYFLEGLGQALNKKKQHDFIFLHGNPEGLRHTAGHEKLWLHAAAHLKKKHPSLGVKLVYVLNTSYVNYTQAVNDQAVFDRLAAVLDKRHPVPSESGPFTLLGILVEVL